MKKLLAAGMTAVVLGLGHTAFAGPPSKADVNQNRESIRDYYRIEKRLKSVEQARETADPVVAPEAAEPERKGEELTLRVSEIVTGASDILTPDELEAITGPLEGRVVSLGELLGAVDALNALYREKGFVTARAILPPQTVEGGVVTIRLVEGRVGDVQVKGAEHLRESFLRDSLTLKSGDLVRVDRLEKDLRRFMAANQTPLMSEMVAGEAFGTTDLLIHVKEPKRFEADLVADNLGRANTGAERAGVHLGGRNLMGYADSAKLDYYQSKGSRSLYVEYGVPLNHRGTRAKLFYDTGDIEIIRGEFEDLDLEGESRTLGMEVSHLVSAGARSQMTVFSGAQLKQSESESSGFLLYKSRVHDYNAGLDWQGFDGSGIWLTRHDVIRGFSLNGSRDNYWILKGHLMRFQQLPGETALTLKGLYQISDTDMLPSADQFQLGGMATVRGYDEGLLVGDQGYLLSAELEFPFDFNGVSAFGRPLKEQIRGLCFVDHGGAFPYKGNGVGYGASDFLTSVGTGLRMDLGQRLSGRLVAGLPVGHQDGVARKVRVHFSFQAELM